MDKAMEDPGTVSSAIETLKCNLNIYTIDATTAALPGVAWFTQPVTINIDGGASNDDYSGY